MRKLLFVLSFFIMPFVYAGELPLAFTQKPTVSNMAVGQTQQLEFVIRNNLNKITLPIKSITIVNNGDAQSASVTTLDNECGAVLAPHASCSIELTINNPQSGGINRTLSINYGGRAPLTAPISLQTSQAAYTILIYIVGTDLESEWDNATKNINQMKMIGSTSKMNVVIETGGANKDGWRTVQRQLILHNGEYLISDLGAQNMGLNSTMESFFEWGIRNYPADKYIAVLWDHGGGPNSGFGGDELFNDTMTPIKDLSAVMQAVTQNTGKKFEIIGFDTCLLGNVETYAGLYLYSNYLIGSEDLEPGAGWQYNTFLNYVTSNPTANGLNIGKVIVDGFTQQNEGESTTLSVVNSAAMPELITAINQFSGALSPYVNTSIANWKQVARGRLRTPDYATAIWEQSYPRDVADLTGLASSMAVAFPSDPQIQTTSAALTTAVANAVEYYQNSENRGASFGLTIYFPSVLPRYVTTYPDKTVLNSTSFFSTAYTGMVANYYNYFVSQSSSLVASVNSLNFDGTDYTAVVNNDFDHPYATAGNDACTNVYNGSTSLGTVPCYTAIQISGVTATPAGGNNWNLEFNKSTHLSNWPLINNEPALLIALDTEPVRPNEISYLIPVVLAANGQNGYLSIVKDENGNYEVTGFQGDRGSANTMPKTEEIPNGTRFYLRTYAENSGTWGLYRTDTVITAPLNITFGPLPPAFDAFRFLVSDLTGQLDITSTSEPY